MGANKRPRKPRKIEKDYTPNDIKLLIKLVEPRTILWDPNHIDYKDRKLRESEFQIIADEMDRTVDDCKAKWENLRAQYRGCHVREVRNSAVKWKYFECMNFLRSVYRGNNKVKSNSLKPDLAARPDPIFIETPLSQSAHFIDDLETSSTSFSSLKSTRTTVKDEERESSVLAKSDMSLRARAAQEQTHNSAQIFGDFVADQMRQIKPHLAADLKTSILKLIVESLEKNK
ncbi:uncharacterized protein LOC116805454 [Drosophila grimshawi]|uniref:uncharacterized protein LOC116805454 n=1 Tax=Drosophila grimshawi TaxID=7222 RepID=UPI000C86FBCD|nr:uncharacterized protein LOC116805454 [Drosophila grimshawi]